MADSSQVCLLGVACEVERESGSRRDESLRGHSFPAVHPTIWCFYNIVIAIGVTEVRCYNRSQCGRCAGPGKPLSLSLSCHNDIC